MSADSTAQPWWLSHGPGPVPKPAGDLGLEVDESSADESPTSEPAGWQHWLDGLDPQAAQSAVRAGLGLFAAFADALATPSDSTRAQPQPHDLSECGVCPLCVAVSALKEHEPTLGALVENAMAGVTNSAERLAEFVPNARDAVTDQLVNAVMRNLLARFQS